jgi:hypothetical protein
MAKKPSDKRLTKYIDDTWSLLVRFRADNKCEVCGSQDSVQAHHIIGRGNWRLRWEPRNGVALCSKHHKFDRHQSAHLNSLWFNEWLDKYHKEDVEWLREREMVTYSWKRHEKEDILKELRALQKLEDKKEISNFEIAFDEGYYKPRVFV